MKKVEIIYSDDNMIFVCKPVGTVSEYTQDDTPSVPKMLSEQTKAEIYPVHRLDKNVGGVMIFAKNKRSAAYLSDLIQKGKMHKSYVATVHGEPKDKDNLKDLLYKDRKTNKTYVVKRERKGVKAAELNYNVIARTELDGQPVSVVRVDLVTGRSHQIRVQFASRGYPLVGDRRYGAKDSCKQIELWSYSIAIDSDDSRYNKTVALSPPDSTLMSDFVE